MKVLVIFLILIGFVGTAFAIPEFTESEKVYGADAVIIGQVLSYHDEGKYRFYEISIMNTLSGKLPKETITMRSINESGFDPIDPYNVFEESDLVLLYLKDYGRGFLESTNFSKVIPEGQLQNTIDKMKVTVDISSISPLKQYQTGVSIDEIQCKDGLVLIQKYDGTPACVTESTKMKLIERGWTKDVMDYTNSHPCQKLAFEAFANTTLKRASNTDSDLSVGYGDGENEEFLRSIGCYENRKEWQTQEFLDYLNELLKNKTKFPQ